MNKKNLCLDFSSSLNKDKKNGTLSISSLEM
jgi:hypothetical protein